MSYNGSVTLQIIRIPGCDSEDDTHIKGFFYDKERKAFFQAGWESMNITPLEEMLIKLAVNVNGTDFKTLHDALPEFKALFEEHISHIPVRFEEGQIVYKLEPSWNTKGRLKKEPIIAQGIRGYKLNPGCTKSGEPIEPCVIRNFKYSKNGHTTYEDETEYVAQKEFEEIEQQVKINSKAISNIRKIMKENGITGAEFHWAGEVYRM